LAWGGNASTENKKIWGSIEQLLGSLFFLFAFLSFTFTALLSNFVCLTLFARYPSLEFSLCLLPAADALIHTTESRQKELKGPHTESYLPSSLAINQCDGFAWLPSFTHRLHF